MRLLELLTTWRARAEELKPFAPAAAEAFARCADDLEVAKERARRSPLRTPIGGPPICGTCGWRSPLQRPGATLNEILAGLERHHIVPRAAGGTDAEDNQVLVCENCHAIAHVLWPVLDSRYHGPTTRAELVREMHRAFADYAAYVDQRLFLVMEGARR